MKYLYILAILIASTSAVHAYQIGNSHATLQSCNYGYNADFGQSGYTGTYTTMTGNTYTVYFGSTYCKY